MSVVVRLTETPSWELGKSLGTAVALYFVVKVGTHIVAKA